jgi:hypothetical protein
MFACDEENFASHSVAESRWRKGVRNVTGVNKEIVWDVTELQVINKNPFKYDVPNIYFSEDIGIILLHLGKLSVNIGIISIIWPNAIRNSECFRTVSLNVTYRLKFVFKHYAADTYVFFRLYTVFTK